MLKRTIFIAVALVFVLSLAAGAQVQGRKAPRQNAPMAGDAQRGQGAGWWGQDFPGFEVGERGPGFYRFVNLRNFLHPPTKRELQMIAVAVGLTDEQKQKIVELYRQFRDRVKPIYEQRAVATKEVLDTLQGPSPSKSALEAAADKVAQADDAILDAEFDFWLSFRSILTPQQSQAVGKMIQERVTRQMTVKPPAQPGGQPGTPPQK